MRLFGCDFSEFEATWLGEFPDFPRSSFFSPTASPQASSTGLSSAIHRHITSAKDTLSCQSSCEVKVNESFDNFPPQTASWNRRVATSERARIGLSKQPQCPLQPQVGVGEFAAGKQVFRVDRFFLYPLIWRTVARERWRVRIQGRSRALAVPRLPGAWQVRDFRPDPAYSLWHRLPNA